MNIFENEYEIDDNTVVTLGKFDGLHEGHLKLINIAVEEAKARGIKSLVYTFNQNPITVLQGKVVKQLLSKQEKITKLKELNIDYLIFQDFTYEFSRMSAEEFVINILKNKLNTELVIVGFNYRFGKDAEGDVELLKRLGDVYKFEVKVIEPVVREGVVISSSYIREKELV